MRARLPFTVAAVVVCLLLASAGCTATPVGERSGDVQEVATAPRAEVTTRTITDVISLSATVTYGGQYAITAPSVGSLVQVDRGYEFVPDSGEARALTAPPTATSLEPMVPLSVEVGQGTPLVLVQDTGLTLRAVVTPAQVLRMAGRVPTAVKAQIEGSTGPFDCALNDPRPTESDGEYVLSCRVPNDVPAVVSSTGTLALTLAERENVLALPLEAVAGTRERGLIYTSEEAEPQEVELGISDGAYIEILSGLAEGDTVLIPSPSILE